MQDLSRDRRRRLHRRQLRPFLSIQGTDVQIVNLDKLTYAGNLDTLAPLRGNARHVFVQGDIGDRDLVSACCPITGWTQSSTSPPRATWTAPSTDRPLSSRPT